MKAERGFATTQMLCLLPMLLASGFALALFLSLSSSSQDMTQACYQGQISIQLQIKKSLKKLLKLNGRAASLRTSYYSLRARQAAAVASSNVALAGALETRIQKVQSQRRLLHLEQKALIASSNAMILRKLSELKSHLAVKAKKQKSILQGFMGFKIDNIVFKPTRLAVRATNTGLAPSYELLPEFPERQALEVRWLNTSQSQNSTKYFLPFKFRFKQACSTTINEKEASWPVVTRLVKPVSKLSSY